MTMIMLTENLTMKITMINMMMKNMRQLERDKQVIF